MHHTDGKGVKQTDVRTAGDEKYVRHLLAKVLQRIDSALTFADLIKKNQVGRK